MPQSCIEILTLPFVLSLRFSHLFSAIKDVIKDAWTVEIDPAVSLVMRNQEHSTLPEDSASLMLLAEQRDVLTSQLQDPDTAGYEVNQSFQVMLSGRGVVRKHAFDR